ncbi:hypothetical protein CTRI78_v010551 [Colletotrichum trifolii]|uniref:Zn(2)-C6 fungal-type domain-containing protein n=1 Tax=Colletotrichum trifolii TaxID=5466 RepID=A0A4R8QKK6_COLTR|nr:hypothetical protein CTRI78_v010551 [Colletotrichum trifolii]
MANKTLRRVREAAVLKSDASQHEEVSAWSNPAEAVYELYYMAFFFGFFVSFVLFYVANIIFPVAHMGEFDEEDKYETFTAVEAARLGVAPTSSAAAAGLIKEEGVDTLCDEQRPSCTRCIRRGVECVYAKPLPFRDSTAWAANKVKRAKKTLGESDIEAEASSSSHAEASGQWLADVQHLGWSGPPVDQDGFGCFQAVIQPRAVRDPNTQRRSGRIHIRPNDPGSTTPSLPPSLHSVDRLYLDFFGSRVLEILPGHKRTIYHLLTNPAVKSAALALASANLAVLNGRYQKLLETDCSMLWMMDQTHASRACHYRQLALDRVSAHTDPPALIATQLLLTYLSMELGSVADFWLCVSQLDDMLLRFGVVLLSTADGSEIVKACLNARLLMRYFNGPREVLRSKSPKERAIAMLENQVSLPGFDYGIIGAEATQVGLRLLASRCLSDEATSDMASLEAASAWLAQAQQIMLGPGEEVDAAVGPLLCEEHELLQHLLDLDIRLQACQPPSGCPLVDSTVLQESFEMLMLLDGGDGGAVGDLLPLFFADHDEAMDNAAYVFAHIMCDVNLIRRHLDPSPEGPDELPLSWLCVSVILLLRIMAGMEPAECARRNKYRVSISSMLTFVSMRCGVSFVYDFIDNFFREMKRSGFTSEYPTGPVELFQRLVCTLRREYQKGRRPFLATVAVDAYYSKMSLFSAMSTKLVAVQGRDSRGGFFRDVVAMEPPNVDMS